MDKDNINDRISSQQTPKQLVDNLLVMVEELEKMGKTEEVEKVLDMIDDVYYNSELSEPLRRQILDYDEKLESGAPVFLHELDLSEGGFDLGKTFLRVRGEEFEVNMGNYRVMLSKLKEDEQEARNELDDIINKQFKHITNKVISENDEVLELLSTDNLLDKEDS